MHLAPRLLATGSLLALTAAPVFAQGTPAAAIDTANDPVREMVSRLDLEKYKATIKGLTKFGDRRQGTARNRAAVDWIEAQLKSYGCTPTERITYDFQPPPPRAPGAGAGPRPVTNQAQGGGRLRGIRRPTGVNTDSLRQPDAALRELN